jgi:HEAT repeat protein
VTDADAAALPVLCVLLHDPDESVRRRASVGLQRAVAFQPAATVVPTLYILVQDPDPGGRADGVRGLGAVGKRGDVETLPPGRLDALPALVAAARENDVGVRGAAVWALARMGPGEAAQAVPALIRVVREEHGAHGVTSPGGMWPAPRPDVLDPGNTRSDAGEGAVRALGRVGRPAVPALNRMLEEDDALCASSAAALGMMAPGEADSAVPALVRALRGSRPVVGFEYDGANESEWFHPHVNVAHALAWMGRLAVPALTEALADPKVNVRNRVADTLAQMGPAGAAAVPALVRLLRDGKGHVNAHMVRALAAMGPAARAALPALRTALQDGDCATRDMAAGALKEIDPEGTTSAAAK